MFKLKDILDKYRKKLQPKKPIIWGHPTHKQLKGMQNDKRS